MFVHHWHIFMYVFIYIYVSSLGCTGPTLRTLGGFLIICSKCNVLSVGKILKQRVLSVRMEILENFLSSKCMFVTYIYICACVFVQLVVAILCERNSTYICVCVCVCMYTWKIYIYTYIHIYIYTYIHIYIYTYIYYINIITMISAIYGYV